MGIMMFLGTIFPKMLDFFIISVHYFDIYFLEDFIFLFYSSFSYK